RSLRAELEGSGPVPPERAIPWLLALADALASLHRRGLVHGDVKPENVIVRDDGVVKLLDFGLSRALDAPVEATAPTVPSWVRPPDEGRRAGTPGYMAPELTRGEPIDSRADQFALGVVAYELLIGERPRLREGSIDVDPLHSRAWISRGIVSVVVTA